MIKGIDFIAHHALQAQSAESVFEALQKCYRCRWRIGADQAADGESEVAILLDHRPYHPRLRKSHKNGYRHLIHMSHDLGDVDIYRTERMDDFDIVLVPGPAHRRAAQAALGRSDRIVEIGWPKFDTGQISHHDSALINHLHALPSGPRILYAPTWPNTWEWQELLPWLSSLPCILVIKNHILVDPGKPFPPGEEVRYADCRRSIDSMENYVRDLASSSRLVAPAKMNLCALFPHIDMLITDSSSCAIEFAPFGISIETGRTGAGSDPANDFDPQGSRLCSAVRCLTLLDLKARITDGATLSEFIAAYQNTAAAGELIAPRMPGSIGPDAAEIVSAWLTLFPEGAPRYLALSQAYSALRQILRRVRII